MTALLSPSMPMQMAPERFTLAFSKRMTVEDGFFSLALSAAIGPAVPPPITRTSQETSEVPSMMLSMTWGSPREGQARLCLADAAAAVMRNIGRAPGGGQQLVVIGARL